MKTLLVFFGFLALAWCNHEAFDEDEFNDVNRDAFTVENRLNDFNQIDDDDDDEDEDEKQKKPCILTNKYRYDHCGRKCHVFNGRLVECTRIRKDFESMSKAEQIRFIRAFKIISTHRRYRPAYVRLIKLHEKNFMKGIHTKEQFFPWHRWFNLQLENMLRKVDCKVTLPYWDWSIWSHDPWNRERIWGSVYGLGGNGRKSDECVTDGPFRVGSWKTASGHCLKRSFNGKPPDADEIAIATKEPNFDKFEVMARITIHEGMHCFINGTMCSGKAAEAPEFFLHHGFVDKMWADYQKQGSYHKNAFFPSIKKKMTVTRYYPKDLIDNLSLPGGVRVEYQDPTTNSAKKIRNFLRVLSFKQLEHLQRLAFSQNPGSAKKLFNLSANERKFAAGLEKESMQNVDSKRRGQIFARTLSSLERVEGFSIPSYCKS